MSTQIQAVDLNQIQAIGEFGVAELMAMKESIAKKLTIPQFNLFMYQMNRMGLDPSLGHGVPILYGTDVNIRIEYEGIKSLAQKSDGYKGIYSQAIHEEDEFWAEADDDGVITKVHFKIGKPPRGKVVGAYAVAKREGHKDVIIICENADYEKYVKKNSSFWKLDNGNIDPDMAKKFVATRAVKAQFNITLVVEENMMALGSGIEEQQPQGRKDITAEANHTEQPLKKIEPAAKVDPLLQAMDEMQAKFIQFGITEKEEKFKFFHENGVKMKDWKKPTLAELQGVIMLLDQKIADKQAEDEAPLTVED